MPRLRFVLLLLVVITGLIQAIPSTSAVSFAPSTLPNHPNPNINLQRIGRFNVGPYRSDDPRAAEIVTYDSTSKRMIFVSSFDSAIKIVDISNPTNPITVTTVPITPTLANVPNSVDVRDGIIAVAANAGVKTDPGRVAFFDINGMYLTSVTVGALPDMLTYTPNGQAIVVANEGEPNSYGQADSVDPEGSISIIHMPSAGIASITTTTVLTSTIVNFRDFNLGGSRHSELDANIRIFGPNASVAQDLEPEYIAVTADSQTAYVTLQENNALAIINLPTATVTKLVALGFKNYNLVSQGIDASDLDGANLIKQWPVYGMYQPDTIASYTANGQTYVVTANEGDARDYVGFKEEARVKALALDSTVFTDGATLKLDANLGRLNVTKTLGNPDGDADYDALYSFGARSFSIWNANGGLVVDSGDDIEQRTAARYPANFNANSTSDTRDNRSDDKGPEPEALEVATINGHSYAFVGLERMGGIMVYDISDPTNPLFVEYQMDRNFPGVYATGTPDDLGPEGMTFIPADQSPNGAPLLLVANEVSGSVSIYQIQWQPKVYLPLIFK